MHDPPIMNKCPHVIINIINKIRYDEKQFNLIIFLYIYLKQQKLKNSTKNKNNILELFDNNKSIYSFFLK